MMEKNKVVDWEDEEDEEEDEEMEEKSSGRGSKAGSSRGISKRSSQGSARGSSRKARAERPFSASNGLVFAQATCAVQPPDKDHRAEGHDR